MTLNSALDMLEDLRILEIVDLDDMEVYIGHDEEQTWIKDWRANSEGSKSTSLERLGAID